MRLLIVDDEHYIVNYLAALVEAHAPEDLEVYKCYSGMEALELSKTMKIHLALLDIRMPGLSGIETASRIRTSDPDFRVIFLTAFDNFEHIYAADKLPHSRYLLKTEKDEVILSEIFSAVDEIKQEADKLHLLSTASQNSLLLSHLLEQTILKEIFSGEHMDKIQQSLQIAWSKFPLDLQRPVYLMYTQIHHRSFRESHQIHSGNTLEYLQLMQRLCVNKLSFSMLDLEHGTMLWLFQPSASDSSSPVTLESNDLGSVSGFLESLANDFSDYCTTTLHRRLTVVLYPAASPWDQIYRHFFTLQRYADSFVTKAPLIYSSVNILDDEPSLLTSGQKRTIDRTEIDHLLQELTFSLYQGIEAEYSRALKKLCQECIIIRSMHDIRAIKIYMSVALILLNYIDLYQLQERLASKIALYQLYYLHDFSSWKESSHYLETISRHLFEIQNSKKTDKNNLLVQKIKLYIEQHLADSLNLATISRVVNYNETYISRLFKQLTGTSLSEYISQEKIQKAKQLLSSTNESIQNIAAVTGFDTSQYFSLVFKKMTGVSPSTYRKTHLYTKD